MLILDEVITGFGRLGAAFGADHFGVVPDIMTVAKGLTSGAVPMGAVLAQEKIQRAIFEATPENGVELPHGYTYSAHPLAAAAAVATLDLYRDEGLFERARALAPYFENAVHALKGLPHVIDIRNLGMVAAIELDPLAGQPGERAFKIFLDCYERGLLIRTTGDVIALSPPLIAEKSEIDRIFETIAESLRWSA
jgi:beta-alanine--pyruvate transaminase